MRMEVETISEPPKDWPANATEVQLDNIWNCINIFRENPSYKNKEILVSLVASYDLNQQSHKGLFRTTEYEVARINSLFLMASVHQIYVLKVYLYELVGKKTRMQKMASWISEDTVNIDIPEFNGLIPQLKLYYKLYQIFTIEKERKFSEYLLKLADELIDTKDLNQRKEFTNYYISLLNDLSYFRCKKTAQIWAFNRDEITQLFKKIAKLIELNQENPTVRPLKGVLMTFISNYILKSRNNYNEDYIYKYITPKVANQSIQNHELWISEIEKLNDEREQKVISEILEDTEWCDYPWIQNINLAPTRKYYVACFSKSINNKQMQEKYGSCIYGYKDDRIAELISPTMFYLKNKKLPAISQVISFDVIYDKKNAINELKLLCSIINCFNIADNEKKNFLEEILQYWILSVKDSKWEQEQERRYVIFMYDQYEYPEITIDDSKILKIKTSLFLEPDFILGENPVKNYLKSLADEKRNNLYVKPYLFCNECLNRDFDIVINTDPIITCPICGSTNISVENRKLL